MKLLFLGSGAFGVPSLDALASRHEVLAVVTQPDRPAGRGQAITPTPVAAWVRTHRPDLPLFAPPDVNEPQLVARLRLIPADAWVVIAFGQKLSPALVADRFAINLHASLLPRWRGAAPINHAILAGDAETGNSVITIADRMDAGLVLAQSHRTIDPLVTAGELHDQLSADGPALLLDVLERHQAGTLRPRAQDTALVTRAGKFSKADAWTDFAEEADRVRCRIHGLNPWPGVAVAFRNHPLRLLRVRPVPGQAGDAQPGTLVDAPGGVVACGRGTALKLLEVQPNNKRSMTWAEFHNGAQTRPGERLTGGRP
ncbi:MAG: methionyl-tRNA formyltransferase [Phycisphaerales bacterium]|nr:methionyl-tRNA formyltransferase [Phycisphaerales bacterium]